MRFTLALLALVSLTIARPQDPAPVPAPTEPAPVPPAGGDDGDDGGDAPAPVPPPGDQPPVPPPAEDPPIPVPTDQPDEPPTPPSTEDPAPTTNEPAPTVTGGPDGKPICECGYTYCASVLKAMKEPWSDKQLTEQYCNTPNVTCPDKKPRTDVQNALYVCLCQDEDDKIGTELDLLCGCDECLVVGPDYRGRCATPCYGHCDG